MKRNYGSVKEYIVIVIGSVLYAVSTHLFIFPTQLLLGGTSGISVILNHFFPFLSSGKILMGINILLLVAAYIVLGRGMAVKTFVGSTITTLAIGGLDILIPITEPLIGNTYISAIIGASIIAVASAMLFYVNSSSGGTDIIALIVKKYSQLNIGKALLVTDFLIVIVGGIISGLTIASASMIGLLIKTLGIDLIIGLVNKRLSNIIKGDE